MSALGFGAMRLPVTETAGVKHVDYDKAVPMMQRAFELGVNYIDTAPYYCEKDSEVAVGKALKGWRDKVYLSTKNPVEDDSADHWRERLEGSLKKLDVDYIDFYHMWGIGIEKFRTMIDIKGGPIDAAKKALDEGLIKHLSFSFHDDAKNMIPIIDSGYFSSVLCQYNLLDRANEESIAHATEKGLGVVIMGPVGGGRLGTPSEAIKGLVDKNVQSTAEMALRFVLANPNVSVALSGMSEMAHVEENAKVASIEGPLTDAELAHVAKMLEENKRLAELYCTGCKYCMPCPQGINIPHVFGLMNYHRVYGLTDYAKKQYEGLYTPIDERSGWSKEDGLDASKCVECGQCEEKCPQHLKIIAQLKETHDVLS
jgi:predicted aldo/keto reductase-like oxidoreductase